MAARIGPIRIANRLAGVTRNRSMTLFWVEGEFDVVLREAELGYVRQLIDDIESGALDGTAWWREMHARADDAPPLPPPFGGHGQPGEGTRCHRWATSSPRAT
jgi:hypothetical protein